MKALRSLSCAALVILSLGCSGDGNGVFRPGDPYPIGHDQIEIGDTVSHAKEVLKNSDDMGTGLRAEFADGPFSDAIYAYSTATEDPEIVAIVFTIRRDSSRKVAGAAAAAFKELEVKANASEEKNEWPNVKGCKVTLYTYNYSIEPSDEASDGDPVR